MLRLSSGESQVKVFELDIGGHETCHYHDVAVDTDPCH